MPVLERKVVAYITHGDRLLVFRHPYVADAGIQVPAGTIEAGERPEDAVLREATEETGLTGLRLVSCLGTDERSMADVGRDELHHRWFYHLRCGDDPPETWRHLEAYPSDGSPEPIVFEFFWVRFPNGVPELIADQGRLLPRLATFEAKRASE